MKWREYKMFICKFSLKLNCIDLWCSFIFILPFLYTKLICYVPWTKWKWNEIHTLYSLLHFFFLAHAHSTMLVSVGKWQTIGIHIESTETIFYLIYFVHIVFFFFSLLFRKSDSFTYARPEQREISLTTSVFYGKEITLKMKWICLVSECVCVSGSGVKRGTKR